MESTEWYSCQCWSCRQMFLTTVAFAVLTAQSSYPPFSIPLFLSLYVPVWHLDYMVSVWLQVFLYLPLLGFFFFLEEMGLAVILLSFSVTLSMLCLFLFIWLVSLSSFLSKRLRSKIDSSQNNSAAPFHSAVFLFSALSLTPHLFFDEILVETEKLTTSKSNGNRVSRSTGDALLGCLLHLY